ncbi:MAG TPA: hypothetical protein VGA71_07330, partial [Actinomycetota bacterium]
HRLLGEVEVARQPDERRDRPSAVFAEQAVDDTLRQFDPVRSLFDARPVLGSGLGSVGFGPG